MVEEKSNTTSKTKSKGEARSTRPKIVYLWTVQDVLKWLKRHCGEECYNLYAENFIKHEITGRVLIRVNENILVRLGVDNTVLRQEILKHIMKIRLRTNLMEIMESNRRDNPLYHEN